MSDIQDIDFSEESQVQPADPSTLMQSLATQFPLLKEILTGAPSFISTQIAKLAQLTQEQRHPLKKYSLADQIRAGDLLLEQFKKIQQWTDIDHLQLFNNLVIISKDFWLDLNKIYKNYLLQKVDHGLHFLEILEKLEDVPVKGMHYTPFEERNKGPVISKQLKNSYEVTRSDAYKNDSDYKIQNKRYEVLNEEQKLKYRVKLLRQLTPRLSSMVRNPGPFGQQNSRTTELFSDVDKLYALLETTPHLWLFEELLKIQSPRTMEYKKILCSLKLLKQEGSNEIKLENNLKLQAKFISQKVLQQSIKADRETDNNLFSEGNFIESNGNIYLKYDISQLLEVSLDYIGTIRMMRQVSGDLGNPNSAQNSAKIKHNYINILSRINLIIKNIAQGLPIYTFDCGNFIKIQDSKAATAVIFCLKMIHKIVEAGHMLKINELIAQILITPDLISIYNKVLRFTRKVQQEDKPNQIFILICKTLEQLLVKSQIKMTILNNGQFLQHFIQNINRILLDQKIKAIPSKVQTFIVNYIQKLFQFGLCIDNIKLQRLYELKLANIGIQQSNTIEDRELFRYMHMNQMANREQVIRLRENRGRSSLQDFIRVFPGSIQFFSGKLIETIGSLSDELKNIDIFDVKESDKFRFVLKLLANDKISSDPTLNQQIKILIKNHPTVFANSTGINWSALKDKFKIDEETIYNELRGTVVKLRQNFAIVNVEPQQLCESVTTTNKQLIEQINLINYVNLLLKIRQKQTSFAYLRDLLEFTLFMEKLESISLNKIVKYQGSYSISKLKEVTLMYKETLKDKSTLHFKLARISVDVALTCWQIFAGLQAKQFDLLLRQYDLYFQAMKDMEDKNLSLKLLKKTYRNIADINKARSINFNFQLYNHHQSLVNEVIKILYLAVSDTKGISRDTVVMGETYVRFVQKCQNTNKDAALQYNRVILPHIESSLQQFMNFMFFKVEAPKSLLGNKYYSGDDNLLGIVRSLLCDIIRRASTNLDLNGLIYCNKLIQLIENKGLRPFPGATQIRDADVDLPENNIKLFSKQQKDKSMAQSYLNILQGIKHYRYSKNEQNILQNLFFLIVDKLRQKYNLPKQEAPFLTLIIKELGEKQQKLNEEIFKIQCLWIDSIMKKVQDFKIQDLISVRFVKNYLKLTITMLQKPEQYKDSLPHSIGIIGKFVPRIFTENKQQLIQYTHSLLSIIIKVANYAVSIQKINCDAITSIIETLISTKLSDFNPQILTFLKILRKGFILHGTLICQLIEKQTQVASMQADIKGLFLRQSDNLVDQSQERISIRLNTFINTFKSKYQEQVSTFSNLTSKFVKKSIRSDDKKETAYLSYEKSNLFYYSEILKKDFINFEPSDTVKLALKDLLTIEKDKLISITQLDSLRDIFYYSPILIPYIMLHPIQTSQGEVQFIEYLITSISKKRDESINKFLLFACLDHSCMIRLKDRTAFFSEYLLYRIIKKIFEIGINKYTLLLIYYLAQLKRFAFLCKIKLQKKQNKSLANFMIDYLKASREGFHYKSSENNIVSLIMAIIFKQDSIDNLKKCFLPKRPKEFDRQFKLINECLIPYNVYYRRMKEGKKFQTREDNIIFTGNYITPYYAELHEDIYLNEQYNINLPKYSTALEEMDIQICDFSFDNISQEHIKNIVSTKIASKYKKADIQLITSFNDRHKSMVNKISEIYFKDEASRPKRFQPNANIFNRQEDETHSPFNRGGIERMRQRDLQRMRRGRGRGRPHGNESRNQRQYQSRYAQQDFRYMQQGKQQKKKTIQVQFQKSLNVVPSQQVLNHPSQNQFENISTSDKQLEKLIDQINDKLFLLGKQPLNQMQLNGKNYLQKKNFLQHKFIEIDFDYNKNWLQQHQFEQYCLINSNKINQLDENRRQQLRKIQERMFTLNLDRSSSADSIGYIMDTIDENYQHINTINRTLSHSSLSSDKQEQDFIEAEGFYFEQNKLSLRAFSQISQELLYEMLLSFYYVCEPFASKQFMPFLQNKRMQNRLINTLLFLMKNPFNNSHFPHSVYRFNERDNTWKAIEVNNTNIDIESQQFIQRIIPVFQSVKNYSFYQNNNFLFEEINNEGILGIYYQAKTLSENNTYMPIYEIFQYAQKNKNVFIEFLKGVEKLLPEFIDKIINFLVESQAQKTQQTGEHTMVMGRVFQRQRIRRDHFPYDYLKELYKNQDFQIKFREKYVFGEKDPSPAFLTHLIDSNIYSVQQLKIIHTNLLLKKRDDTNTLEFLNKVIKIYTDQQLKNATWLKQYKETITKTIQYLTATDRKLSQEPIFRALSIAKNDLGFEIKRGIFQKQMAEHRTQIHYDYQEIQKSTVLSHKKKGIFESAFEDLRSKPDSFWLSPFMVKFIDKNGNPQTGYGDGPRREWFTFLSKGMVNLNNALFRRTKKYCYFFNRESYINPRHLQYLQFIGKLFGYSLTKSSILVSPNFSLLIYKIILGQQITFKDVMNEFDEDEGIQFKSAQKLVKTAKTEEEVQNACLSFIYLDRRVVSSQNYSILINRPGPQNPLVQLMPTNQQVVREIHTQEEQRILPQKTKVINVNDIIELKLGGAQIPVTLANMHQYLDLMRQKVYDIVVNDIKKQAEAFMSGFKRVVNPKLLSRFNAIQLRKLVEGEAKIDIEDLQKHTRNNDLDPTTTSLFWQSLKLLSNENRALFVWFWTGVDKIPQEGAKIMGLSMNAARGKLFIAHTCPKSLEVPKCHTKDQMEQAILIVINIMKSGEAIIED